MHKDLQKIKRFCRHINQLPIKYHEVVEYLGYSEYIVEGLGPNKIAALHQRLQELADIWVAVESKMIEVSSTLVTFSGDLNAFGSAIIDLIKSMASYKSHQGVAIDVNADDLSTLPQIPLEGTDLRALPSLVDLTQELVAIVDAHKKDAHKVKMHLEYFRSELRTARDDIARKLALAVKNDGTELITTINEELTRYNLQIEELGKTYRTYTRYKWVGAWWGPVGLVITASIYGPQASDVKAEHDSMIEQKKSLEEKLSTTSKTTKALITIEADLQNMQLLAEEALSGAGNLENIWTVIGAYITASVERIRTTHSATTLFLFEARLSHMLAQWRNVEKEARTLMQALNQEADEALPE